jgi:hypothetical protein
MKQYGICNLAVVPVRAEASDKSEMTSQLLFGEGFTIIEETEKWIKILTSFDNYIGWIDNKQYQVISEDDFTILKDNFKALGPEIFQPVMKASSDEIINVTAGSSIPFGSDKDFYFGSEKFFFSTIPSYVSANFEHSVVDVAKLFLNSPYLWGGRSMFGIDCSGFSQVVFKMFGLFLKRDAWQQAEQGQVVNFLQEAKAGDLAFFDNEEGLITHVGIMINGHEIIHASGRVKIDPIDDQGIYSLDLKKHSHKLRIIKR